MIRLLNLLALVALIASATWAYSVKYETILVAEKLRKREAELQKERDATAILQAEWHLLNRPARMQAFKRPDLGLQSVSAKQIVKPGDIPERPPEAPDALDNLLTGSIPATPADATRKAGKTGTMTKTATMTPATPRPAAGTTPMSATPVRPKTSVTPATTPKISPRPVAQAAPVKLTPPQKVGPAPTTPAAPAPQPARDGGLTGFLKRLVP